MFPTEAGVKGELAGGATKDNDTTAGEGARLMRIKGFFGIIMAYP